MKCQRPPGANVSEVGPLKVNSARKVSGVRQQGFAKADDTSTLK
jgi:hypothetical protein